MKVDDLNFNLEDYLFQHRISFTKGFLPDEIPVSKIDTNEFPIFQIFEDFVAHLKQYYLSGSLRFKIENLPKVCK